MNEHLGKVLFPVDTIPVTFGMAPRAQSNQIVRRVIRFVVVNVMRMKIFDSVTFYAYVAVAFLNQRTKFVPVMCVTDDGFTVGKQTRSDFAICAPTIFLSSPVVCAFPTACDLKRRWMIYCEFLAAHFANTMLSIFAFSKAAFPGTQSPSALEFSGSNNERLIAPAAWDCQSSALGEISALATAVKALQRSIVSPVTISRTITKCLTASITNAIFDTIMIPRTFAARFGGDIAGVAAKASFVTFFVRILKEFSALLTIPGKHCVWHRDYSLESTWCNCIIPPMVQYA
jgi:hypothetical protein